MEWLLFLPVLLFSIIVHECAHGWVALRQGDATAYMLGRLTLNPVPHVDLFGSVIVPLVLWVSHAGFLFGWAKPVPVNPRNFRDYRRGDILVSLAGVAANLALAVVFTLLIVGAVWAGRLLPVIEPTLALVRQMAGFGVVINLVLAVFNLIPIPPLDGSHVPYHLLPARWGARYRELGRYGILVLLAVLFFAPRLVSTLLWPVSLLQSVAEAIIRSWT
jgi:Zn-dependent protease